MPAQADARSRDRARLLTWSAMPSSMIEHRSGARCRRSYAEARRSSSTSLGLERRCSGGAGQSICAHCACNPGDDESARIGPPAIMPPRPRYAATAPRSSIRPRGVAVQRDGAAIRVLAKALFQFRPVSMSREQQPMVVVVHVVGGRGRRGRSRQRRRLMTGLARSSSAPSSLRPRMLVKHLGLGSRQVTFLDTRLLRLDREAACRAGYGDGIGFARHLRL